MKYMNANRVLPDGLIRELQEYIQGGYLYVPVKEDQHRDWGEQTGYREEIRQRNETIRRMYREGTAVEALSETYFLSVHAIRKILYKK